MLKIETIALTAALAVLLAIPTAAQVIERINLDCDGAQSAVGSTVPRSTRVVSADGRFVVFSSAAADLVANDTNGVSDVFLRDRSLGITTRISVNGYDGGDASGESHTPSISANGRFIAFASLASDLVDGDGNGYLDIFVYDRVADEMVRASFAASVGETDGDSKDPFIGDDGRYVVFNSTATNLVAEGANTNEDIYLYDVFLDEITKVSERPGPVRSEGYSRLPAISADGRHVVFSSRDTGFVPGDTNGTQDVFVKDLQTGAIDRVSVSSGGAESNGWNGEAAISSDGAVVAWWSTATNLVEGDDNAQTDIFVRDRVAGTTTRVNLSSAGEQAIGAGSWHVTITNDGRFVVFLSDASNLHPSDVNGTGDVFSHDRLTGITRLHSLTPGGSGGNSYSRCPSVTGDGVFIAFESGATDLVVDDDNAEQDVFFAWGPAMIMEDGFESAGCSRWSAEVGACDPDGTYASTPPIFYSCAQGLVTIDIDTFVFTEHGAQISGGSSLPGALVGMSTYCGGGEFSNAVSVASMCTESYTLEGSFTDDDTWEGTFSASFTGATCMDCTDQVFQVTGTRQ